MDTRLKEARERRGLSQEELSVKSGVSRTIISYLETGKSDCAKTTTLVKLADALEMKVSELFF